MGIDEYEYIGSFAEVGSLPGDGRAEIAFYGRSNVGKSSIINTLLGARRAAFTSKKPGRTGNANYLLIDKSYYFVDMPGYGFAKVSKTERKRWMDLLEQFLKRKGNPKGIVFIIDVRRKPTDNDRRMIGIIQEAEKRFCLVFNKIDKLKKGSLGKKITENLEYLDVSGSLALIPFSCETGGGKKELSAWIYDTLSY